MATATVAEKFLAWLRPDPSDTQPLPEVGEATTALLGNPPDLRRRGAAAMISEALSGAVTLQTLSRSSEDLAAVIQDSSSSSKDKLTVLGLHEENSSTINFDWAFSGFDVLNHSFHPAAQLLGEHTVCKSVVVQDALQELATLKAIPQDSLPEGLRLVAWQFACNSVLQVQVLFQFQNVVQSCSGSVCGERVAGAVHRSSANQCSRHLSSQDHSQSLCNSWH